MDSIKMPNNKDIEENKVIAAIGYISILCFIPLLLARESKFAQFHAKQGLVLFITGVIIGIANQTIFFYNGNLISAILSLAVLILSIIGFIQALGGKWYKLPLIADFARKINL